MKKKDEIKVCLVGSSGGHLTHLYMLKPFWKDKDHFWVTFDKEDAPLMLEWMHDPDVVQNMQADFAHKTLSDCENFIRVSYTDDKNLHLAVVDDNNTYMGTVSLKNIENDAAEFAITVRKNAMGKGFSKYAMSEIIRIGLEELNLKSIYWCVSPENKRAVKFYDKNGYMRIFILLQLLQREL